MLFLWKRNGADRFYKSALWCGPISYNKILPLQTLRKENGSQRRGCENMRRDGEYCGNCNHSTLSKVVPKLHCHLTDELVETADNCGLWIGGNE